jgi:hypothetical protein
LDRHHPPKDCAAHPVRLRPQGADQLQRPKSQHPLPVDVQLTSGGQRPVTWHQHVGIIREAGVYTLESGGPYSLLIGTQHTPRDTASRRASPRQAGVPSPAGRRTRRASGASGGRGASLRRPRPRKTEECSDEGGGMAVPPGPMGPLSSWSWSSSSFFPTISRRRTRRTCRRPRERRRRRDRRSPPPRPADRRRAEPSSDPPEARSAFAGRRLAAAADSGGRRRRMTDSKDSGGGGILFTPLLFCLETDSRIKGRGISTD